jgi:hypothetical protein
MAVENGTGETDQKLTIEQRVDLVLDLTRRLELLDDLLNTARGRRGATDTEVASAEWEHAELDNAAQAVITYLWTV